MQADTRIFSPSTLERAETESTSSFYVICDIEKTNPGYGLVEQAIACLGTFRQVHDTIWLLRSSYPSADVFQTINRSLLDRRIDSGTTLFVLEAGKGEAHWYLRQPLSDLLEANWAHNNNLFVAYTLKRPDVNRERIAHRISSLGSWAAVTKRVWYINAACSAKQAFQVIADSVERGDRLCVLDHRGQVVTLQDVSEPAGSEGQTSSPRNDRPAIPANRFGSSSERTTSLNHR